MYNQSSSKNTIFSINCRLIQLTTSNTAYLTLILVTKRVNLRAEMEIMFRDNTPLLSLMVQSELSNTQLIITPGNYLQHTYIFYLAKYITFVFYCLDSTPLYPTLTHNNNNNMPISIKNIRSNRTWTSTNLIITLM